MKLCYVCSKVGHWFMIKSEREAMRSARLNAMRRSEQVKELGYIPISAPLIFVGLYNEKTERDKALAHSIAILKKCDALAYSERDLMFSEGMKEELETAKLLGLEIVKLS